MKRCILLLAFCVMGCAESLPTAPKALCPSGYVQSDSTCLKPNSVPRGAGTSKRVR